MPAASLTCFCRLPRPSPYRAANANVAAGDLNARAGLFFNEQNGQPMLLAVNKNTLAIAGGGALVPLAADRFRNRRTSPFFMSEAEFELQFLSADLFEIKTKEGETTKYRRAGGYAPTEAELKAFAGQYDSNETGAVMEMVVEKGGLVFRYYRNPAKALQLKPVDRDTFMISQLVIRFVRDKDGKVVGYDYSNPLIRNIRYHAADRHANIHLQEYTYQNYDRKQNIYAFQNQETYRHCARSSAHMLIPFVAMRFTMKGTGSCWILLLWASCCSAPDSCASLY